MYNIFFTSSGTSKTIIYYIRISYFITTFYSSLL
nr:MAG TPA: hypothetical protein [Caudoviricetes sp.]DAU59367.1 MAG TPA: hypothetical protein [Crassvirales sp.]